MTGDGDLIATCLIGVQSDLRVLTHTIPANSGHLDVHLSGQPISSVAGSLAYETLVEDHFYRIESGAADHTININVYYTDYSYYIYDKAGRVIAAIQPEEGLSPGNDISSLTAASDYDYVTTYKYNALGWLLESVSPDEGEIRYAYRRDGGIRYSEDARQRAANKFSYVEYDRSGRVIEMGEATGNGTLTFADAAAAPNAALDPGYARSDVTQVSYDLPDPGFAAATPTLDHSVYVQRFTLGARNSPFERRRRHMVLLRRIGTGRLAGRAHQRPQRFPTRIDGGLRIRFCGQRIGSFLQPR